MRRPNVTHAAVLVLAVACSKSLELPQPPSAAPPLKLFKESGDGQTDATVGQTLREDLVVRAQRGDKPAAGVAVAFAVAAGGGSLSRGSVQTDDRGFAAVQLQLGPAPGLNKVTASAESALVEFTATARVGAPAAISIVQGSSQSGQVGLSLEHPLRVRVVDSRQNPVPGVPVEFAVRSTVPATLQTPLPTTDDTGHAQTLVTLGEQAGDVVVEARTTGVPAVPFALEALPGPLAALVVEQGLNDAVAGETLPVPVSVVATDRFGNPRSGATVTATGAGPAVPTLSPPFARTLPDGRATFIATLGPQAGPQRVDLVATLDGSTETAELQATARAGAPVSVCDGADACDAGPLATGVGGPASRELLVRDALLNPVEGVQLLVTTGGAPLTVPPPAPTDSDGRTTLALTAGTVAGTYPVEISSPVRRTLVVRVLPGEAAALAVVAGDAQNAVAGRSFAAPLVVRVADAHDNAVADRVVLARAEGLTLDSESDVSDAAGLVSFAVDAGTEAGYPVATFELGGGAAVARAKLRVTCGEAVHLEIVGDDARTDTVGASVEPELVVRVSDVYSNPVPNVLVSFSSADEGASLVPFAATNEEGLARSGWRLGEYAGPQRAVASVPGLGAVSFHALALAGAPTAVLKTAGDLQYGEVCRPVPLVVTVTDRHGNPVSGVDAVFERHPLADGCGDDPDSTTETTDALGRAAGGIVAGYASGTQALTVVARDDGREIGRAVFQINVLAGHPFTMEPVSDPVTEAVVDTRVAGGALTWRVYDRYGNLAALRPVRLTVAQGGGAVANPAPTANGNGVVTIDWRLGTSVGLNALDISSTEPGAQTARVWVRARAGSARHLVKLRGDQARWHEELFDPIAVLVTDAFGNPVDDREAWGPPIIRFQSGSGLVLGPPVQRAGILSAEVFDMDSGSTDLAVTVTDTRPGGESLTFAVVPADRPSAPSPAAFEVNAESLWLDLRVPCAAGDVLTVNGTARTPTCPPAGKGSMRLVLEPTDVASPGTLAVRLARAGQPYLSFDVSVLAAAPFAPMPEPHRWPCGAPDCGRLLLPYDHDGDGVQDVATPGTTLVKIGGGFPRVAGSQFHGLVADDAVIGDLDADGAPDWINLQNPPATPAALWQSVWYPLPFGRDRDVHTAMSPWLLTGAVYPGRRHPGVAAVHMPKGTCGPTSTPCVRVAVGRLDAATDSGLLDVRQWDVAGIMSGREPILLDADLTGDGQTDVLVVSHANAYLLRGPALDLAAATSSLLPHAPFVAARVGQFAPGNRSVTLMDQRGSVRLFQWNGADGFTDLTQGNPPQYGDPPGTPTLRAGDVDGDGLDELVVLASGATDSSIAPAELSVFELQADGVFARTAQLSAPLLPARIPNRLEIADLDGDGRLDLLTRTDPAVPEYMQRTSLPAVLFGDGQGRFRVPASTEAAPLVTGDFDGNGQADLVAVVDQRTRVLLADGKGGWLQRPGVLLGCTPLAVAEMTGDAVPDLLCAGGDDGALASVVPVLANGTLGTPLAAAGSAPSLLVESQIFSMARLDLGGDAWPDAVALAVGRVGQARVAVAMVLEGTGAGRVKVKSWQEVPRAGYLADVDGDGVPDHVQDATVPVPDSELLRPLAVPAVSYGSVAAGRYELAVPVRLALTPGYVAVADTDADGLADLVSVLPVADGSTDNRLGGAAFSVLRRQGARQYAAAARGGWSMLSAGLPANVRATTVGDFNNDGVPDVAVGSALLLQGRGWSGAVDQQLPWRWEFPGRAFATRLDGDSKADVLFVETNRATTLLAHP